MGKTVLPYKIPSVMLTYPYNAFFFGIYEGNNMDCTDIILNDFLEIYYFKKDGIHKIDFKNSGLLECSRFNLLEFPNTNSIVETLKEYLDQGYYAIIMLNQKYLKNEKVHTDWERNHDWLIYGYDDSSLQFYCSSYLGSKDNEIMGTIKLNYMEVEKAYKEISPKYLKPYPSYFRNHFVKINPYWVENKVTNKDLYCSIRRMFFPRHSARDGYWHPVAGIHSFNKLLRKIKRVHIIKNKRQTIFIQNIRIIYDFRENVLLCLKKMNVNINDILTYETIVKETYKILLFSSKYNQTGNQNTLIKVYEKLKVSNKIERQLLKKILKTYKP